MSFDETLFLCIWKCLSRRFDLGHVIVRVFIGRNHWVLSRTELFSEDILWYSFKVGSLDIYILPGRSSNLSDFCRFSLLPLQIGDLEPFSFVGVRKFTVFLTDFAVGSVF